MLACVFAVQAFIVWISFKTCGELAEGQKAAVKTVCPELAQRAETLFGVATATVLSLLTGESRTR